MLDVFIIIFVASMSQDSSTDSSPGSSSGSDVQIRNSFSNLLEKQGKIGKKLN